MEIKMNCAVCGKDFEFKTKEEVELIEHGDGEPPEIESVDIECPHCLKIYRLGGY